MEIEIEIIGESLGEAKVNLNLFKKKLSETWNMEAAVKESTKITKMNSKALKTKTFLDVIYYMLEWGKLIDVFKKIPQDVMNIKVYKVVYKDWRMFKPEFASIDARKFKIAEEDVAEGEDIIILQDLRKDLGFSIKNFIDNMQFKYAFEEWGIDFNTQE